MKNLEFTNFAVFVLFFGLALVEVFQEGDWLQAALFLSLSVLSLWADFKKRQ